MKAYIAAKFKGTDNKQFLEDICNTIESLGIETFLFIRDIEKWGKVILDEREVMKKAKIEMEISDILIIELSEQGMGLGIEAGWANMIDKNIIVISKENKISPTLRGIMDYFITYSSLNELKQKLKPIINKIKL